MTRPLKLYFSSCRISHRKMWTCVHMYISSGLAPLLGGTVAGSIQTGNRMGMGEKNIQTINNYTEPEFINF
jgi:hypothetical protein